MDSQAKPVSGLGHPIAALVIAVVFGAAVGLMFGVEDPAAAAAPDAGVADEYSIEAPVPLNLLKWELGAE